MQQVYSAALTLILYTLSGCMLAEQTSQPSIYLDQGWSETQRQRYYHTSQGTRMLPYAWFMALEQPSLDPAQPSPPFHDSGYLATFGFLPNDNVLHNPDRLPVGFTKTDAAAQDLSWVGITCAACHTGELRYQDRGIRIDGGAAMINLGGFEQATQHALKATLADPMRFERFAQKVLKDNYSSENYKKLFRQVTKFSFARSEFLLTKESQMLHRASQALQESKSVFAEDQTQINKNHVRALLQRLQPTPEPGFGRLDALGQGGNYVFGYWMGVPENIVKEDGPVSYPPLWDTWMFDWVQYGGQIRQPMARNVAQALGVFTPVTLRGASEHLFKSDVDVQALHQIESLLQQLAHPPWPENILGKINRIRWAKGKALFATHCASCHQPRWSGPDQHGNHELQIKMIDVDTIGTDRNTVKNFKDRTVNTGDLAVLLDTDMLSAKAALEQVTQRVIIQRYQDLGIPKAQQAQLNGCRDNKWRAEEYYRARPLNGIWTSAPFLHNGSVPNLWQLLGPWQARDKTFYVGSTVFDPDVVGFVTEKAENTTRFDTRLPGNSNRGHEFTDRLRRNGVIGPALSDDERWALIEYLKDMDAPVYPATEKSSPAGGCQVRGEYMAIQELE